MTDREILLLAYGALKSTDGASQYILSIVEKHLAIEIEIEKRERKLDREE